MSACLHALTKDNDDDNDDDNYDNDDDVAAAEEEDDEDDDVLAIAWQSCFLCQIIRVSTSTGVNVSVHECICMHFPFGSCHLE